MPAGVVRWFMDAAQERLRGGASGWRGPRRAVHFRPDCRRRPDGRDSGGRAAAKLNIDCSGIVNLGSIGSIVLFLALLGSLAYVCMGGKKKA